MLKNLVASLFVLFWMIPVHAQQSRWENLDQVRRGAKIQVVEQSLKSTSGKFLSYSEEDLTLEVQGKQIVIAKQHVYRVSVLGKNRKRNALIGTAVGAAAGLGVGLAIMERESGFGGAVAGLTVGYAGVGAGVGALMPASRQIYRAEMIARSSPNSRPSPAANSLIESGRQ